MSDEKNKPQFLIQKIYTKSFSCESPKSPQAFRLDWKPEANLDLAISNKSLSDIFTEVDLNVTFTVKNQNETVLLAEISQTGVFVIQNIPEQQKAHLINAYCPSALFPYVKELINQFIQRSGFQQVSIAPINFDALYLQDLQRKQQELRN